MSSISDAPASAQASTTLHEAQQRLRKALVVLVGLKKGSHLAGIYLASDGKDIFLADEESATSLLERPGQMAFGWRIPLAEIQQEVRAALRKAA